MMRDSAPHRPIIAPEPDAARGESIPECLDLQAHIRAANTSAGLTTKPGSVNAPRAQQKPRL